MSRILREDPPVELANPVALVVRDGRSVPIEDTAAPILDSGGRVIGAVLVFHDVTEKRRAEEEKSRLEARLRQVEKLEAIGTLAGGIAHDFNNILMAILGNTELALDGMPPDSRSRSKLEQVIKSVHRTKDLVRQILVFSRHGRTHAREPVLIGPIVKDALRMLRATLPSTIEFVQDISAGSGTVMGDPTQLHQVVLNLCNNAAHAMHGRVGVLEVTLGEVEIDAVSVAAYDGLEAGRFWRLAVKDTGCGMDSATLQRIFEPYFTTREFGRGSGLGLAVVHGIVRRHEGAVSVRSEPEKGTTFEILLPGIEDG